MSEEPTTKTDGEVANDMMNLGNQSMPFVQPMGMPSGMPMPQLGGGAAEKFISGIKDQLKGQLLGEIEQELLTDNFEGAVDRIVKAVCTAINRKDNEKIRRDIPEAVKSLLESLGESMNNKIVDDAEFPVMVGGGDEKTIPVKPMAQHVNQVIVTRICESIETNPSLTDSIVDAISDTIAEYIKEDAVKNVKRGIEPISLLTKERFKKLRDTKEKIKETTKKTYNKLINDLSSLMNQGESAAAIENVMVELEIESMKLCTNNKELEEIYKSAMSLEFSDEIKKQLTNTYNAAKNNFSEPMRGGKPPRTKRRKIQFKKTKKHQKK